MTDSYSEQWFLRLDAKLDKVIETVSSHGSDIATHTAEIASLKDDVRELRDRAKSVSATRLAVWIAIASIVSGGGFSIATALIH